VTAEIAEVDRDLFKVPGNQLDAGLVLRRTGLVRTSAKVDALRPTPPEVEGTVLLMFIFATDAFYALLFLFSRDTAIGAGLPTRDRN